MSNMIPCTSDCGVQSHISGTQAARNCQARSNSSVKQQHIAAPTLSDFSRENPVESLVNRDGDHMDINDENVDFVSRLDKAKLTRVRDDLRTYLDDNGYAPNHDGETDWGENPPAHILRARYLLDASNRYLRMPDHKDQWKYSKDKIMGEKSWEITDDAVVAQMSKPSSERPRVYGFIQSGPSKGQTVKITSQEVFDTYKDDLAGCWISGTTYQDMIRPAKDRD